AARVANAVLLPVGVVGVAGAELRGDVRVVLAALVGVADQQRDRGAGGAALVDAGKDLHLVGLAPRRGVARLAGGAALQVVGELLRRDLQPGRTAVDDAADGRAVRLAEGGDRQQPAEGVAAQDVPRMETWTRPPSIAHRDACCSASGREKTLPR